MDSIRDALLACDIVLLQHEIPQDTIEYVIDICHENGVKVVLNPGPARPVKPEVLAKVDYLTPNEHEAAILFGDMPVEEMLRAHPGKLVITQVPEAYPHAFQREKYLPYQPGKPMWWIPQEQGIH